MKTGNKYIIPSAMIFSCLSVLISFLWQGNKAFSLSDEGFLWYGVQRVLLGEIPIRDFMSYDPGRYYWVAAFVSVFGNYGIMGVRAAVAVFQAIGLFIGLMLVVQSQTFRRRSDILFYLIAVCTLILWMFPRHKLFDISISIIFIGILTYLIRNPTPRRYFFVGACVGLAAVFGRNHGLYCTIASFGTIAWLSIKNSYRPIFFKVVIIWALGVVIGYLPIILMALLIDDFANAFWEGIRFQIELGSTNIPLPIPWPWKVIFSLTSLGDVIREILIGLFFIGTLIFAALSIIFVVFSKLNNKPVTPSLVASAFLAVPYAHYAFSRADVGHLAHGVFPLLVGSLSLLISARPSIKWPLTAVLCGASFWITHVFYPGWQCLANEQCVNVEVAGSELQIDPGTARDIALLRQLAEQYAPNGEGFITTPFWPGAYALLERKSPMWETYALFPRSEAFEKKEIERIKSSNPAFVFVSNGPLDERDELRFKNTHPLIYQYILNNFEPLLFSQNANYEIYKVRDEKR